MAYLSHFQLSLYTCFWYNNLVINEADFKKKYSELTPSQLLDLAYVFANKAEAMEENYNSLRRRYFGRRSEQSSPNFEQQTLFNEAETVFDESKPSEMADKTDEELKKELSQESEKSSGGKKKNKGKKAVKNKIDVEDIDLWPEDRTCPKCGSEMSELKEETVSYLEHIPERYVLKVYHIHKLVCHKCSDESDSMVIREADRSALPVRLIPGSRVAASSVSHFIYSKFLLGVPYYRKEVELKKLGVPVTRANMCRYQVRCSDDYAGAVYERMHKDLKDLSRINLDETHYECLEQNKLDDRTDSWLWAAMSNPYEAKQMALYFYFGSREHANLKTIIGDDYHGTFQSDGYQAYDNYMPRTGECHKAKCWQHVRSKFHDAVTANDRLYSRFNNGDKDEKKRILEENPGFANNIEMISLINRMFRNETLYKDHKLDPEQIRERRNQDDTQILEDIHTKALQMEQDYAPKTKTYTAVTYLLNQWEGLQYFLEDGHIPLSNNVIEREGIKPVAMSRKNFLFSDTIHGAESSAIWFSILISARMNHLDPQKYIVYMLEELAKYGCRDDVVERLLPYSPSLPDSVRLNRTSLEEEN